MKNAGTKRLTVIGGIILLLLLSSLPVLAGEPIKVGLISPLTGQLSSYGESVRNAVVMAVDEINAAGGVNGREIALTIMDDKGDATESANSARRLIDRDEVSLIIGPVVTPAVMAVAPIAQDAGIPLITPTGTGDAITAIGDLIFRAAYKDSFQGQVMARFAKENLDLTDVAIIYDLANDYSTGLMQAFRETFQEFGGNIITVESYQSGDSDFSAQLTSVIMRNPEAIFIPDYHPNAGPIIMQARQLGFTGELLGVDGWDSPELTELAGGLDDGGYIVNHYSTDDESESTQQFIANYEQRFGHSPDALAALGYDAALIVAKAIEQAGSTEPQALKQALGTVANVQAATGTINMDPEGTPVKSVVVLQRQSGKWTLVDRMDP